MADFHPCLAQSGRLNMSLSRYWPTRYEVNRCIKAEAESASDAVLLAVHQSMPLSRRDEGSGFETQVSEHDFLEAFLSDDLPQGTLLIPITGPSGVGKSHLIRWLAAQLRQDPRAHNMHVILIPKSASLRDVVELVLEPLSEDPRFSDVCKSLDKAIAQVTPLDAAVRFSGALEVALEGLKTRLIGAIRSNPSASDSGELKMRANHAAKLPGFLNDAALREHMIDYVLAPIILRAVSGRIEPETSEEELLPQFRADDLRIPDQLRMTLGQAAVIVQRYYQTSLNRADGAGFEEAAQVLNEVVDEAIQRVFQLDQATGGTTLNSIILRVRELLLEDGRELVLLVEDFAALSGIQQVLLSVCIQEAERDGRQVRSRMRTALALTDGYLVGRDTIATRARHEWIIQPGEGVDDVVSRTVELCGAYLNAARWGEEALERQYRQTSHETESDLTGWTTTFEDEELTPEKSDQLGSFGISARGVPLFPYNRFAIAELATHHLRSAGKIHFNPRRIINFILRDILLAGRDAYDTGNFPPAGFQAAKSSAAVASWLANLPLPDVERWRLEAVVVYWGGAPNDPQAVGQIPKGVFRAFNLERPKELGTPPEIVDSPSAKPKVEREATIATPPLSPMAPDEFAAWRKHLDEWANGTELSQRRAQKLRTVLKGLIERAIPWNQLRLARRSLPLLLFIPNARGNDAPATIRIRLASDHSDPDGQLRQALLSAIRLDEANGKFDYTEADSDSARVATLTESLVAKLVPELERQRHQEVRTLSWILRRQAQILGSVPRGRIAAFDSSVQAVKSRCNFDLLAESKEGSETYRWNQLRLEVAALRPVFQQKLWELSGCFQGTGNTVFALDPTLFEFASDSDEVEPQLLDSRQREHLNQLKPVRLRPATRPLVEKLTTLCSRLDALLGSERDKQGLLSALGELLESLEPLGVWPEGFDRVTLRGEMEAFRHYDLMAQLQEAGTLSDEGSDIDLTADRTVEGLGRLDFSVIEGASDFLDHVESFVASAQRAIETKESSLSGIDPAADAKAIARILERTDRNLRTIIEDTNA